MGGLLAVRTSPSPSGEGQDEGCWHFPCCDANGNITEYIDADGILAARYEYSPFGGTTALSGTLADSFTFSWSTKPRCHITKLSEYEFRKYCSSQGRWMVRDPNNEVGFHVVAFSAIIDGVSVKYSDDYIYVDNSPLFRSDFLGLTPKWRSCEPPKIWTANPNGIVPQEDGCSAPKFLPGTPNNPGWWVDANFAAACRVHDYCYSNCKKEKLFCDGLFHDLMNLACRNRYPRNLLQRGRCIAWAEKYYVAVILLGESSYKARQEKACHCACP